LGPQTNFVVDLTPSSEVSNLSTVCLGVKEDFRKSNPLMPSNESLHLLKGNGTIVVSIYCLEDTLMSRLPLL
jgi:hypothetical protein